MIIAKFTPKASFVTPTGPFTPPVTIEVEYLTAMARPYLAGASITRFEIRMGNLVEEKYFENISNVSLELTAEELKDWGLDDQLLLVAVATKLGVTTTEFVTVEDSQ